MRILTLLKAREELFLKPPLMPTLIFFVFPPWLSTSQLFLLLPADDMLNEWVLTLPLTLPYRSEEENLDQAMAYVEHLRRQLKVALISPAQEGEEINPIVA